MHLPSHLANLGLPVRLEYYNLGIAKWVELWNTLNVSVLDVKDKEKYYTIPKSYTLAKSDYTLLLNDETTEMLNNAFDP